jgi:DNA (cytosine-5)-methyltransferase 1
MKIINNSKLKVVSLFCGCGGMDLGLIGGFDFLNNYYKKNPFEIVFACDNDKSAIEHYNNNFDHKATLIDVRTINKKDIPAHDILVGGFPCQSFSLIAQNPPRLGYNDENGRLFFEMFNILDEKRPDIFIAENVKGILSANEKKAFPLIIKTFESAGYHVKYKLLNSADYGIPQKRQRVFIVGFKDYNHYLNFQFPIPTTPFDRIPLSKVIFQDFEILEKYYFSQKAVDGLLRSNGKMNKGRVQNVDEPCNTINSHLMKVSLNGTDPVLKNNERYRAFTPREAARIQSFPENYKLVISDRQQYKVIGNAVPPVLMWNLIQSILEIF